MAANAMVSSWVVHLARVSLRWPKCDLLLLAVVTTLISLGALRLKLDPSTERIFPEGHPAVESFQELRRIFGNDEFLVVAYEADRDVLGREELYRLQGLTRAFESLEVVIPVQGKRSAQRPIRAVRSLTQSPQVRLDTSSFPPTPVVAPLFPPDIAQATDAELDAAREALLAQRFGLPLILTEDRRSTALVLELARPPDLDVTAQAELGKATVAAVRELTRIELENRGLECHVAGSPIVKVDIVNALEKDLRLFTAPLVIIAAVMAWFIFGHLRGVLLPLAVIGVTSALLFGLMGWMGYDIHPMTTLLSPLMFVVGIADSIHVIVEIENAEARGEPLRDAIARVIPPCFVTSLTTTIGFASLVLGDIQPVREFGLLAAIGTSLAFAITFLLIPPAWALLPKRGGADAKDAPKVEGLARFVMRAAAPLSLASLALGIACAAALPQISFNTDYVGFFRDGSPVQSAVAFVQPRFGGIAALEIIVRGQPGQVRDPKVLQAMLDYEAELQGHAQIDAAISVADLLSLAKERMSGQPGVPNPAQIRMMEQVFRRVADSDAELRRFVSKDESRARITTRVRTMGSEELAELLVWVRERAQAHFGPISGVEVDVTGTPVIFSDSATAMLMGQIESFLWALGTITVVMIVTLRSVRLGLLSLLPNIFPIAVTFGAMSWMGIPMNSFNSMVASVAIGIAVDDTIHILVNFRRARERLPVREALQETLSHTGAAVLATSFMLACGFGVLCLGQFKPTAHFGLLTCISILSAVVGDLFLLPLLLILDDQLLGRISKRADSAEPPAAA